MFTTVRLGLMIAVVGICATSAPAQQSQAQITTQGVTISEPGIYDLASLFQHSDIVALVKVISGDTESYDVALYKAEVVKNFKGTSAGETIYFEPSTRERVGWESLLFLRNAPDVITPKTTSGISYGKVHYARVFDEGYSSMETSYECVFDGNEPAQRCDYGVRVCTDYIKLPKSVRAVPPESNDPPFGCRWVRRTLFMSLLDSLGNPKR